MNDATESTEKKDEIKRDPASKRPHYFIYKQGKEFWNRWAKESFQPEDLDRIAALIDSAKYKSEEEKKERIKYWEDFRILEKLNEQEKIEAYDKFRKEYVLSLIHI